MLSTLPASLFAGFLVLLPCKQHNPLCRLYTKTTENLVCVFGSAVGAISWAVIHCCLPCPLPEQRAGNPYVKKVPASWKESIFLHLKEENVTAASFQGRMQIGQLCVVLLVIPRAVVWPWMQPQQGAKQESGISHHPEQFCETAWTSHDVLQLYIHLQNASQTNTRKSEAQTSRGVFTIVFLVDIWSLSVMEQPGSVWAH